MIKHTYVVYVNIFPAFLLLGRSVCNSSCYNVHLCISELYNLSSTPCNAGFFHFSGISALHSISKSAPIGSAATPMHVRAGILSLSKNYHWIIKFEPVIQLYLYDKYLCIDLIHGSKIPSHVGQVDIGFDNGIQTGSSCLQNNCNVFQSCPL